MELSVLASAITDMPENPADTVFIPFVAFAIILAAAFLLYMAMGTLRAGKRQKGARGLGPYACGEELPTHMIQPDYGQFYPFAFFFTVLHVVALIATTVPALGPNTLNFASAYASILVIAGVYVAGAVAGLSILYRK
jgi:NADH:ubiquinone oxidoreductase subunit 3 (subunit A)